MCWLDLVQLVPSLVQIRIDMTIGPVEETYALLNRYNIFFNDGNAERVDTLSYGWKKLIAQVPVLLSLSLSLWVCVGVCVRGHMPTVY